MNSALAILMALLAFPALAQEAEIQRSVIQRDQQSAEFAARVRGADATALQQLHARQLIEVSTQPLPTELRPYQRQKMAEERVLALPSVRTIQPPQNPLPLPGGPQHGVEPIALERSRN